MTPTTKPAADRKARQRKEYPAATLDALIEEATVDAYDESEQTAGFYTMLEDHLAVPFSTDVLGMEITVERIDMTDDEEKWIDAYRRWARRTAGVDRRSVSAGGTLQRAPEQRTHLGRAITQGHERQVGPLRMDRRRIGQYTVAEIPAVGSTHSGMDAPLDHDRGRVPVKRRQNGLVGRPFHGRGLAADLTLDPAVVCGMPAREVVKAPRAFPYPPR